MCTEKPQLKRSTQFSADKPHIIRSSFLAFNVQRSTSCEFECESSRSCTEHKTGTFPGAVALEPARRRVVPRVAIRRLCTKSKTKTCYIHRQDDVDAGQFLPARNTQKRQRATVANCCQLRQLPLETLDSRGDYEPTEQRTATADFCQSSNFICIAIVKITNETLIFYAPWFPIWTTWTTRAIYTASAFLSHQHVL